MHSKSSLDEESAYENHANKEENLHTTENYTNNVVEEESVKKNNEETKKTTYYISTENYVDGKINIRYPQIYGLEDKIKEKKINHLIKSELLKTQVEQVLESYENDPYEDALILEMDYQIMLKNQEILSILYTGGCEIECLDFPTESTSYSDCVYAITIDMKSGEKLNLADFVNVDANLVKKLKQSDSIMNDTVKEGNKESLFPLIQKKDDKLILEGLWQGGGAYQFCVTQDSLIVSIEIPNCAGNYVLIEVLNSDIAFHENE